ncbi:MAG TPA: IreB family regulatory phosphoprotein [Ruminococcaceae bacterium]|nr:IreB family regulatory phosphoprotein [Oscillospiraceae bacterium]
MTDKTIQFSIRDEHETEMRKTIQIVYDALKEKGYNPTNQIVGYILSEDPTYITTHNNARALLRRIDRYELLQSLVKNYIQK